MAAPTPVKRKRSEIQEAETPVKESREPTLHELAQKVCSENELMLNKIRGIVTEPGDKGTAKGKVPAEVGECVICSRSKHTCAWEYRVDKKRWTTGSWCFCCVKATRLLGITRSTKILLREHGLKEAVLTVSKQVQLKRGLLDTCRCWKCSP